MYVAYNGYYYIFILYNNIYEVALQFLPQKVRDMYQSSYPCYIWNLFGNYFYCYEQK